MNKLLKMLLATLVLVFVPSFVSAQGTQQQNRVQDPVIHEDGSPLPSGNQVQNQNQTKTQNQGEETMLQVATQEMEQLMEDLGGTDRSLGNQIKTVAQEQVQAQTQIQSQLNRLEQKSTFMKKIFGPDYGAIRSLRQQMEQNRLRIELLTELQNEVTNQADETQLKEAIQILVEQNTSLEEQIRDEEQIGSILGWLVKLFYN